MSDAIKIKPNVLNYLKKYKETYHTKSYNDSIAQIIKERTKYKRTLEEYEKIKQE